MKNKLKKLRIFQKKADSPPAYLIILIIAVAIIVVLTPVYLYFKEKTTEGSIREIRRQNVKNHARAHIVGLDLSSELNFPIIRMEVKKGEEIEKASTALVHDMQDLLKLEKELFPTKTEEIVYCIPGHHLEFEDKKRISIAELAEYQNTNYVNIIGEERTLISEYLTGYTTDKNSFEEGIGKIKKEYDIDTNYDYLTVAVYMKKGYWSKWLSSVFGTGIGIPAGAIVLGVILVPFTGGGSLVISAIATTGAVGGGIAGGVIGYKKGSSKSADWDAGIFLVPNKAEVLKDLKCDILPAKGEIE